MDLVTRIAACALNVEPKVMHALIWEQSGGEPWSFSVIGESLPRVFPTIRDAIREARATRPEGDRIKVGLTGLSTTARSVTAAMFAPCPNITVAPRRISKFAERCKATSNADRIYCAIAAHRGSWDRPDAGFADAVRATVEKGNAPNFDMAKDSYFDPNDVMLETVTPRPHPASAAPAMTPVDRETWLVERAASCKANEGDSTLADAQNRDTAAEESRSPDPSTTTPGTSKTPVDSLFMPRSSERGP
jgi:hypothetical protein